MIQPKSFIIGIILLSINLLASAQVRNKKNNKIARTPISTLIYDNVDYINSVKTVRINLNEKEGLFPVLELNGTDILTISFDDLRADSRSIYYSVEHCNADWTSSRVPILDYLQGFTEDRIYSIKSSENTKTLYTHYEFDFPNENIRPKIAGNYLLKVYEEADKSRLLFTRKFYVLAKSSELTVEFLPSITPNLKSKNQKLNLTIQSFQELINPASNLKTVVFQNQRTDNFQILTQPSKVSAKIIEYKLPNSLEFSGNNEFRTLDLRSARNTSMNVNRLFVDSMIHAELELDNKTTGTKYNFVPDENGKFFIRNLDFELQNIQSDYIQTRFSLKDSSNIKGDIYLVGGFNNFSTEPAYKLTYNEDRQEWETSVLLKQGIYNYEYVLKNNNKIVSDYFSGSYFETENDYQILVYYRKPGAYWDEIIGFLESNNTIQSY